MKIEIGKEYTITNKYKKSYVEFEYFKDDDGDLIKVETGWRSGTWQVTPQNQHEIDMLVAASSDEYDDELCINDFEEAEMDSSWDGCWDDWDWSEYKSKTGEALEEFQEEVQDEGVCYLLDNGWECEDTECYFQGQILIEEVTSRFPDLSIIEDAVEELRQEIEGK
jgi:hypothetical protein